jgi:hypothetical protein
MIVFQTLLFFLAFMLLHEAGHWLAARVLGLSVNSAGVSLKPYPHFYVSVQWPRLPMQKYIYLFAGMALTCLLFGIAFLNSFWGIESLLFGFILQLIVEFNPFHSDILIAILTQRKVFKQGGVSFQDLYKKELQTYHFTAPWYLHFALWTVLIVLLMKISI